MAKRDWIFMGRAAHFIGASECLFHLATYIPNSGVIVSTIGDYRPRRGPNEIGPAQEIGYKRKYETFVFKAIIENGCDCPYHIEASELDTMPANTGKEAQDNHYKMCNIWDKKKKGEK